MRIDAFSDARPAISALAGLDRFIRDYPDGSRFDERLLELVQTRVSQLNRCAFCVDLHASRAAAAGATEQELRLLPVWRQASQTFGPGDQAALDWAEAVNGGAPDDDAYNRALAHFGEGELRRLTYAVAAITAWNRVAGALDVSHHRTQT